jgi:hypothetical protein
MYGRVEESFGTVVIIVAVVAAVFAAIAYIGSGRLYEGIGKGAFSLDEPDRPKGPQPGTAAYDAEAEAETRQLLEANTRPSQDRLRAGAMKRSVTRCASW